MKRPVTRRLRGFLQQNVPLMITCREFEQFVADDSDGTLPWRQRLVFRLHLRFCRECRDYLAAFVRAVELGKSVFRHPDDLVPTEVPEDLVRAILAARKVADE